MTKTLPKLVLSASRDIPFSQLVLSQKNVRRVKAGLSIEDLAEDIYRRTLLQSINAAPCSMSTARKPACSKCRPVAVVSEPSNCW